MNKRLFFIFLKSNFYKTNNFGLFTSSKEETNNFNKNINLTSRQ